MTDAVPEEEAEYDLSLEWPDDDLREGSAGVVKSSGPSAVPASAPDDRAPAPSAPDDRAARGSEGGGLIQVVTRQLAELEASMSMLRSDVARRPAELEAIVEQAVSVALRGAAAEADAAAQARVRELADALRHLQDAVDRQEQLPPEPIDASGLEEVGRQLAEVRQAVADSLGELRDEVAALRRRIPVRAAASSKLNPEDVRAVAESLAARLAEVFEVVPEMEEPARPEKKPRARASTRSAPLNARPKA